MLDWQATDEERAEALPGDELVPEARGSSTHAIAIGAPTADVWPWLIQMGCGRAGFYSYDRLDNGGRASAARILPEFQNVQVGDVLPSRPDNPDGFEVLRLEPFSLMLLGAFFQVPKPAGLKWDSPRPSAYLRATWAFVLREPRANTTRLIVRSRSMMQPGWLELVVNAAMGPAHVVMQRKQLLNLRARIEGVAARVSI